MQKEYKGFNSIRMLEQILIDQNAKKIFLIVGKKSYTISGAKKTIQDFSSQLKFFYFSNFEKNPKIRDVKRGITIFKQINPDVVVAIGGGSTIDMAKLINTLAAQPDRPEAYIKKIKTIYTKPKPLIAIPTTAGSGSEATHFAVVYIDNQKYSLTHPYILPEVSIVDPSLTTSLPPQLTAISGIDALSQAIESYWNVNSTVESKNYATEAISLIMKHLVDGVIEPTYQSRLNLAKAANLAGKAINITKTTAAHAISYPLTIFWGIAHGHAVGILLGEILLYNSKVTGEDCIDPRGEQFVVNTMNELYLLLGAANAERAKGILQEIMEQIGLETQITKLGIDLDKDMNIVTEFINLERLRNNPRRIDIESLHIILNHIR